MGPTMKQDEKFKRQLRPVWVRWLTRISADTIVIQGVTVLIVLIVFVFFLALQPTGDDARVHARHLLEVQGYESIQVLPVGLFACGHGDVPHESARFLALTPAGMRVEGAVCCGWMKNCTIRFE